jgi:Abortive infection alpha
MSGETKEIAKATQEVAKTTRRAIGATEKLGKFLAAVIGEPLDATVGMLTDRLRFMRWQRQIRLADRCMEIIRDRKLKGKLLVVPPKLALPIVEHASLEDNDGLQDLWAHLLVSAMDPDFQDDPTGSFVEIVKQLQPIETVILRTLYREAVHLIEKEQKTKSKQGLTALAYVSPSQICVRARTILEILAEQTKLAVDVERFEVAVDNLIRLGCAALFRDVYVRFHGDDQKTTNYEEVSITSLGVAFVEACIEGKKRKLQVTFFPVTRRGK